MRKPLQAIIAIVLFSCISLKALSQWQLTGNSNATATSVLGTTNALSLNLVTKNTKRLTIDTLGRIGIGTATPVNILTVKGAGSTPAASWVSAGAPLFVGFGETAIGNADYILSMASTSFNARPVFVGRRSRGTLAAPTVMVANDYMMSLLASGYDGSAFQNPAAIDFYVDGTPTAGNVPGRISFVTGTNGSNRAERLKIGSFGDVTVTTGNLIAQKQVGINGAIAANYALGINAGTTIGGISVKDPVDNLILNSTKSGTNTGAYLAKTSTTSSTPVLALEATGLSDGLESFSHLNYGIFASSDSSNGLYAYSGSTYAGYFSGDVYSTGIYQTSDARLKKNVKPLESGLDIINQLQPKSYEFTTEGNYAKLNLPKGSHYGLLAQDIEKVMPGLVKDASTNTKYLKAGITTEDEKGEKVEFKAVNYNELIPVLIKAVQEQSAIAKEQAATIKEQNEKIAALTALVEKLIPGAKAIVMAGK